MKKPLLIIVLCLFVANCTSTLKTKQHTTDGQAGVVYVLPFTQYDIEIIRRVTSCQSTSEDGSTVYEIKTAAKVKAEAKSRPDGNHAYIIDPTSLSHFFNTASSDIKFYDNSQQIKSINASADDKTLSAVGNIAVGIGKVITTAAGFGGPAVACRENVATAVENAATAKRNVEKVTKQVDALVLEINRLKAKLALLAPNPDEDTKNELSSKLDELTQKQKSLQLQQKDLEGHLKIITHVQKVKWPENSTQVTSKIFSMPEAAFKKWSSNTENLAELNVVFALERVGSYGHAPVTALPQADTIEGNGIRYRNPAQGMLVACSTAPCKSTSDTKIMQSKGPVAQLGYISLLTIEAKPFESASFSATFSESGMLTSAGYKKTRAAGESVGSFTKVISDQYSDYLQAKETAQQKALDAELKRLESLQKIREAELALTAPDNSENEAQLSTMQSETALINAQIALINAQRQLETLQENQ